MESLPEVFIPYHRAFRACTHCRREKSRCDEDRPCSSCLNKGRAQTCIDGCEACRQRKLTCDGNQPCSPCAKNGLKCLPLRTSYRQHPHSVRPKHTSRRASPQVIRPLPILPRPSVSQPPLLAAYQPPEKTCHLCKKDGVICNGELPCSRCSKRGSRCVLPHMPGPKPRCASCREKNTKCERARPCQHCVNSGTECIDMARKGKGQGLRVKRACAACRADKVQCDVDRPCNRCQKKGIECIEPCKTCGGWRAECASCGGKKSGATRHDYEESPPEASTSTRLLSTDTPVSPSSPSSPDSPLSPYLRRGLYDHTAASASHDCSLDSASLGHEPPTPRPSPSPVFLSHPYLSQPLSTSPNDHGTMAHIAASSLALGETCSSSEDYKEPSGSPMSPLSPNSPNSPRLRAVTSFYHEPHSYPRGNNERPASPASRHPSPRHHTMAQTFELRSYPEDYERCRVSQLRSTFAHDHDTMAHICTPASDQREMASYSEDYEESSESSLSLVSPDSPRLHTTSSFNHPMTGISEARSHLRDYDERERPMSPASRHPSLRRLTTARMSELRLHSEDYETRPLSPGCFHPAQERHPGSRYFPPPPVAHESGSAVGRPGMHSHSDDEASSGWSPTSSDTSQTALSSHSTASSADPRERRPSCMRDRFHYDPAGALSQPLDCGSSLPSYSTRSHEPEPEPPKVTLPSFAEAFPDFVEPFTSRPVGSGDRVNLYRN